MPGPITQTEPKLGDTDNVLWQKIAYEAQQLAGVVQLGTLATEPPKANDTTWTLQYKTACALQQAD